jgi:hypothetical protein
MVLRERLRVVGLIVLAIIAVGVFSLFWATNPSGRDIAAAGQCRDQYRIARTVSESVLVDAERPILGKADAPARVTCASLRARGLTD